MHMMKSLETELRKRKEKEIMKAESQAEECNLVNFQKASSAKTVGMSPNRMLSSIPKVDLHMMLG